MRHPQVIICSADDELANELRPLAQSRRWTISSYRRADLLLPALGTASPTVLLLEVDPLAEEPDAIALIPELVKRYPDLTVIVRALGKIPEAQRPNWTAVVLGIGASYVLFPPITITVLEDLLSGAILAKMANSEVKNPLDFEAIDLAEEGQAEDGME
jgi:hypothetical protein